MELVTVATRLKHFCTGCVMGVSIEIGPQGCSDLTGDNFVPFHQSISSKEIFVEHNQFFADFSISSMAFFTLAPTFAALALAMATSSNWA